MAYSGNISFLFSPATKLPKKRRMNATRLRALSKDERCSICLEAYALNESISDLKPCRHLFHHKCIARWLRKKNSCPMCRAKQ